MKMKAFISHSSAQQEFAEMISDQLGPDQCVIDSYDFAPAYKTMDEIIRKLNDSIIFVFLISKESIKSDWCKSEVRLAKELTEKGRLKLFLPYIIDADVNLEMVRQKYDWIVSVDTYNLKLFRSPILVARDIELKFRQIERSKYPYLRAIDEIFEGRNDKIDEFQTKKSRKRKAKSLIISGRPGTGRHRFSQRCADDIGFKNNYFFENVDLPRNGTLLDLIVQLNPITSYFSEEQLIDILHAEEEEVQLDAAVALLNEIYKYQGRVRINDNSVVVNYKSDLSKWFIKLLKRPGLKEALGIFLISTTNMKAIYEIKNPEIIAIRLSEFSRTDREKILVRYLDYFNCKGYSDDNIEFFVDKLKQSPSQLVKIAEIISTYGVGEAVRNVEEIRLEGDYRISDILTSFKENQDAIDFLVLLSHTGMISYDDIKG